MTPQKALMRLGRAARGSSVLRRIHAAPVKTSYLVEQGGERFILRMDTPLAEWLGLDRKVELDILSAAWHAGVGPEPIAAHTDPPAVLLTRYVPGRAWTARDLRDQRNLHRLAELLRRVHAVEVRHLRASHAGATQVAIDRMHDALMRYAERVGTSESKALGTSAAELLANLRRSAGKFCLCHYDPIAGNIVGFRRTLLIDWEYAGQGDPLFDLAVVIRHHGLSPRATSFFAASYFGAADRVPWARLDLFYALYDHVLALWLLLLGVRTRLSAEQRTTLRAVLRRIRPPAGLYISGG